MLAVLSPTPSVSLAPVDLELPVPDALPSLPQEGLTLLKAEGIEPDTVAAEGQTTSLPVLAYTGGAFATLGASGWNRDDLIWAQDRLGILSNVYGLLRPLDRVPGKTLQMDGRIQATDDGGRVEAFWKGVVSPALDHAVAGHRSPVVVNLAAGDYYDRVKAHPALARRVINVIFEQEEGGGYTHVQALDAEARRLMAAWIVRNRLDDVDELKRFDVDGYRFNADRSSDRDDTWVFTRPLPARH